MSSRLHWMIFMWNDTVLLENVGSIFFNVLVAVTKIPDKNNLREGRVYFVSQLKTAVYHEEIMVLRISLMAAAVAWSSWSHKSSVRKQREINAGAKVDFSFCTFYSVLDPVYGTVLPTLGIGLPSLIKLFWKYPQSHIERIVSWIILNPIKLAMKVNYNSFQE